MRTSPPELDRPGGSSPTVLISGAGSGIGLASALFLAERGFRVVATVPDLAQQATIDSVAAARSVSVDVRQLDVTDASSIQRAVDGVIEQHGAIDAVVHSAGLGLRGFFEDLSEREIRRLFDVNVFGVMALSRAVLPHMRTARRGRLVIVGSMGGRVASMSLTGYCAGKFALEGFAESLWMEVRPFGIQVSIIEPGLVMTPHFTAHRGRAAAATDPQSAYFQWFARHEQLVDNILRARWISPADVAGAIHRALTERRPRLRYPVGRGGRAVLLLRRALPQRWFERLYFGRIIRMVTRPATPSQGLSQLSLAEGGDTDYLGLPPVTR